MTTQEIFDKVVRHLLTQNKKSLLGEGQSRCAYRGHDGTMCAIGCLIPDELYNKRIENRTATSLPVAEILTKVIGRELSQKDMSVISVVQSIHDFQDIEEWKERLEYNAKELNLTMPEL